MFDFLLGWRKASNCKKLIKTVQCRLKILKSKRWAIAKQLREDVAHLLKNGHEQIAFNRLEQVYKDENIVSAYELLDHYSEFIVLHLPYIRRHKDLPNDINEAVSTLIFASARCGDLPELSLLRKLFRERYGQRFASMAVEFQPGNLVSFQVKDKLTVQTVPEREKNRLLDEIVRDYLFKSGPLALEYKPEFHAQPARVTEVSEVHRHNREVDKVNFHQLVHCEAIAMAEILDGEILDSFTQLTPLYDCKTDACKKRRERQDIEEDGYSSESSTEYPEDQPVIYLDDVEEFKSPIKETMQSLDQDQRIFVFKSPLIWETKGHSYDPKLASKRMRRRSVSMENNRNDAYFLTCYSKSPHCQRRYQTKNLNEKRICSLDKGRHQCSLDRPCYFYNNDDVLEYNVYREEIEGMGLMSPLTQAPRTESIGSRLMRRCLLPPPYVRAVTTPQRKELELHSKEICRSNSVPINKVPKEFNGASNLVSPPHVHPKLPDYDEIAAKFRELKKVHQRQNKCKY